MSIIDEFIGLLGKEKVLQGENVSERAPHIWRPSEKICAKAILLPSSTEEVTKIASICTRHNQPMVVQGGLTNLVRSTETTDDDVIISTERLNNILEVDTINRTMTVEAGAILQDIQEAAEEHELFFPLNFGAKGSCRIGGCVSTNAGGLRVLKYGMTRNQVLGLEAVMADGTVLSSMHKMMKNNTGYDLKHLIIGAEGTLAIVTKVLLRLYELPSSRDSGFVAFDRFEKVLQFLKKADKHLAGNLTAYEIFWNDVYQALTREDAPSSPPLASDYPYYVLFESRGGHPEKDRATFEALLSDALEEEIIVDGAMAHTNADHEWFWNIREDVGVLLSLFPYRQDFDISLPIDQAEVYVSRVKTQLKDQLGIDQCYVFGHLGDGNLHLIVGKQDMSQPLIDDINRIVYEPLSEFNGSVSAEHGIGLDKMEFLPMCRSESELKAMKAIKMAWDPLNILNRGKVFTI